MTLAKISAVIASLEIFDWKKYKILKQILIFLIKTNCSLFWSEAYSSKSSILILKKKKNKNYLFNLK